MENQNSIEKEETEKEAGEIQKEVMPEEETEFVDEEAGVNSDPEENTSAPDNNSGMTPAVPEVQKRDTPTNIETDANEETPNRTRLYIMVAVLFVIFISLGSLVGFLAARSGNLSTSTSSSSDDKTASNSSNIFQQNGGLTKVPTVVPSQAPTAAPSLLPSSAPSSAIFSAVIDMLEETLPLVYLHPNSGSVELLLAKLEDTTSPQYQAALWLAEKNLVYFTDDIAATIVDDDDKISVASDNIFDAETSSGGNSTGNTTISSNATTSPMIGKAHRQSVPSGLAINDDTNRRRLVQRYALASLYFSTEGNNWNLCGRNSPSCGSTPWLTNGTECDWFVVKCDAGSDVVAEINFRKSFLAS